MNSLQTIATVANTTLLGERGARAPKVYVVTNDIYWASIQDEEPCPNEIEVYSTLQNKTIYPYNVISTYILDPFLPVDKVYVVVQYMEGEYCHIIYVGNDKEVWSEISVGTDSGMKITKFEKMVL